jgi:cytochrome P450
VAPEIILSTYADAHDAYRRPELRQAQYSEAGVVLDGVLVNLHGREHRERRITENRLFRRDTFLHYEYDVFPEVLARIMRPAAERGSAELVGLSHAIMLELAVLVTGVDLVPDQADTEADGGERARRTKLLAGHVALFIEALTLAQSTLDKDDRRAAIAESFAGWRHDFLDPSLARRRALLADLDGGTADDAGRLPRDLLTILAQNQDRLGVSDDLISRETAFFLVVAAHTSATAFVRATHHMLDWLGLHPEDSARVGDPEFVQRCVHETIRLNPSSTVGMRRALEPVRLQSGIEIPRDALVVIDLRTVNRDTAVYGDDAAVFDPHRKIRPGVMPFGLSFAAGMHMCIGQDLAAGVLSRPTGADRALYGLVAQAARAVFAHGVRRDPDDPPVRDTTTTREYWARYPVLFGADG